MKIDFLAILSVIDFSEPKGLACLPFVLRFALFCITNRAMQTLVLRIPDNLAKELEAEAKKSNLTKSEIARRRLIAGGEASAETAPTGFDLIADLVGTVGGGPADMSTRKKHYLKTTAYGEPRSRR